MRNGVERVEIQIAAMVWVAGEDEAARQVKLRGTR